MSKRRGLHQKPAPAVSNSTSQTLDSQIQALVNKKNYPQAIRKLQQGLKRDPNQQLTLSEADLWLMQGKDEFDRAKYPQAEISFQKALNLELRGDPHYWLAKCWLAQQQPEKALALFQSAFEAQTLPKDLNGCYLKLLFLNDQTPVVEQLLTTQSKRFNAPQLHWARGALALHAGTPKAAIPHIKKISKIVSPGDSQLAWEAYTYQQAGDWDAAQVPLGITDANPLSLIFRHSRPQPPAVQIVSLVQLVETNRRISTYINFQQLPPAKRIAAMTFEVVELIGTNNFQDAAQLLGKFSPAEMTTYPELKSLYHPLMLNAGQQALNEDEPQLATTFWKRVIDEAPFNPQLALNLHKTFDLIGAYTEDYKLLNQLLKWLQQEAKQNPQQWPEQRLKPNLALIHCWLADNQMASGRSRDASRSLNEAERLAPTHPELIGRRGLELKVKHKWTEAIPLLTQALDGGCEFPEVYQTLIDGLERTQDPAAVKAARRKYGKRFGDLLAETEVEVPDWVEALSTENYELMSGFATDTRSPSPAMQAVQIFLAAATEKIESSDKITLNQAQAAPQWNELLKKHEPTEQVAILAAIWVAIQLYARRNKKGITALQADYAKQVSALIPTVAEANIVHLMFLVLKPTPSDRLELPVHQFLKRADQPGNALAKVQLQARQFGSTKVLHPHLEARLKQDPQNPLLLLATATCHPYHSAVYQDLYDQGFDLARRLQDTEALQAFREEEWFQVQKTTRKALGSHLGNLGNLDRDDMIDILRRMLGNMFNEEIPPEVVARMLPELMASLEEGAVDYDDDDDYEDDFDDIFILPPPGRAEKTSKKRKPWYQL